MAIKLTTIDLSVFPVEKTTFFGLIREKGKEKTNLQTYINEWDTRFPEVKEAIKQKQSSLTTNDYASCLKYFNAYNLENDNIDPIRPLAIKQINNLLEKKEEDNKIVEVLKEVGIGQKSALEEDFDSLSEVAPMIFIHDSIESFYLKTLPEYIQERLDELEPIKFEALDQEKLKTILSNENDGIFTAFYSVNKVEEEYDLNDFQTNITNGLNNLENLIKSVRDSNKNKELNDLKEAWRNNFADRGLGSKEYLKEKELSVETINKVGESLKTYDDTFSYMDSKHTPDLVKEWWGKVRTYWKEKFLNNYGIGGGIEDITLIKLKKYIESKKEELNNRPNITQEEYNNLKKELDKWLKEFSAVDYPNGAEEVKGKLEDYRGYVSDIIEEFSKQQNYILETDSEGEKEK